MAPVLGSYKGIKMTNIEIGDLVKYKGKQSKEEYTKGVWLVVDRWQSFENVGLELVRRAKGRWDRRTVHPYHLDKISSSR